MAALRSIKDSHLAIDASVWMAHRMSYLKKETLIPWQLLELQSGAGYARTRDFRRTFALQLVEERSVYPVARWELTARGLRLRPSPRPDPQTPGRQPGEHRWFASLIVVRA